MVVSARNLNSTENCEAFEAELVAANINPSTYLATDYLNHYNEITMLLEMLPDMPDMVEECLEWKPKSYPQHFEDSCFQAKALAIEAYSLAPPDVRSAFEDVCASLDALIKQILNGFKAVGAADRGLSPQAQDFVRSRIIDIQDGLGQLNKIIHGTGGIETATPVSALEEADTVADAGSETQTQADIDKLFD